MAGVKENLFVLTPLNFKGEKSSFEERNVNVNVERYDPLIFCRTCANIDSCLVPIFKDEGIYYELNNKIEKYLPIKVSEKDNLPLQICYHCASTIIAWDNLLVGCVEAEKKLTLLRNSLEDKECKQVEDGKKDVVQCVDSDDEPLIAKKSSEVLIKVEDRRDILQGKNDLQTLEPVEVEREILMEEPDLSFAKYQQRFQILGPLLSKILNLRIDDPYCCDVCDQVKKVEFSLKKKPLTWEGRSDGLGRKARERKTIGRVVCENCGKVLSSKLSLRNHMKTHISEKSLTCHLCGKAFRHRFNLLRHLRVIHEGVRNHVCIDCGKRYRSHGEMEDHRNVHNVQRKIVCEECGRIFLTKAAFYPHKKSHRMNAGKKKSLEYDCEECHKKFTTKKSRNQHMLIHTGEKPLDCTVCGKKFRTKANYSQHAKVHSDVKPFGCDHCGKAFGRKDHLRIHLRCHTGEKPFVCNFCGRAFAQINDMKKHCRIHEKKSWKPRRIPTPTNCKNSPHGNENIKNSRKWSKCGKTAFRSLKKHVKIRHPRQEKLLPENGARKCPICRKTHRRPEELAEDLYSHVDGLVQESDKWNPNACKICNEVCEPIELPDHILLHIDPKKKENRKVRKKRFVEEEEKFTCEICGKTILTKYGMKRHLTTHSGEKKYTCHQCGKQYAQESGLKRHVLAIHKGVRKYKCPICAEVFGSNSELKSHQDTHTDPRPFQCDECGKTYISQKHLYHHRKYHHTANGMRQLCSICNKFFSSPSVLRRHHKVVHLRLKEFQCHICSAQLSTKHYLKEHLRLHSDERPEVCSICGKTFQVSGNLRQHLKTHMGKTQVCYVCGKAFTRRCHLFIHMGSHRGLEHPQCQHCKQVFVIKSDFEKHMKKEHGEKVKEADTPSA